MAASELAAARDLRAMMQVRVVLRGDGDYARTRQILSTRPQYPGHRIWSDELTTREING